MNEEKKQEKKEKDLDRMTVKELKVIATETTDLVGVHAMKKAELVAAIKQARGITEEKAPKKKVVKGPVTVKDLKVKIMELKAKRQEARKVGDKRMVGIYKRKINRLRKGTRKVSQA